MTSRLLSLLIWAAVAASAVYWGMRLFVRPTPVPAQAVLAGLGTPAVGDLTRLLGVPPVAAAPVDDAPPVQDGRFKLIGVVAPRGAPASGLALISVDGKPARAVAVGREVEPGLRLLTVSHRQAELGTERGKPGLSLALPPLPEATRGRLGDAETAPMQPRPGTYPPGATSPGMPRMQGAPIAPPQVPVGLPPVQVVPDQPADASMDNSHTVVSHPPTGGHSPTGGYPPTSAHSPTR